MKPILIVVLFLVFSWVALFSQSFPTGSIDISTRSQIIHVPSDYPTIQQGIDASAEGDTVLVDIGVYAENISFKGKKITLASLFLTSDDTTYISKTIIDGSQKGSVVTFNQGEDSTAVMAGFTITNGLSNHGGGIHCDEAGPVLRNMVVKNNEAGYEGGGIYLFDSDAHIVNSRITSNYSGIAGGGMICFYSDPVIESVIIADNNALVLSGGIHLEYSSPVMFNTLITGNSSDRSGGLGSYTSSFPILLNVTFANNTATLYHGGGMNLYNSEVVLTNVIMWGNSPEEICFEMAAKHNSISVSFSDISGGPEGILTNDTGPVIWLEGNIDEDPGFSGAGEYPYSLTDGSPCIDTGTPDTAGLNLPTGDLIGNYRIWDGNADGIARVDMGAYEYGSIPVWIRPPAKMTGTVLSARISPNPVKDHVSILYELNEPVNVVITIYSQSGTKVCTLSDKRQEAGRHQVVWRPAAFAAGEYFCHIAAGSHSFTGKMVVVR